MLESRHVGMKACSNCGEALHKHIELFVGTRVALYEKPTKVEEVENRRRGWTIPSADPRLVDSFMDSGFWYDPETELLCIDSDFAR